MAQQQPRKLFQVGLGVHQLQTALLEVDVPMVSYIFPYHYLSRVKRSRPWSKATCFAKRFNATTAAFAGPLALHTEFSRNKGYPRFDRQ